MEWASNESRLRKIAYYAATIAPYAYNYAGTIFV